MSHTFSNLVITLVILHHLSKSTCLENFYRILGNVCLSLILLEPQFAISYRNETLNVTSKSTSHRMVDILKLHIFSCFYKSVSFRFSCFKPSTSFFQPLHPYLNSRNNEPSPKYLCVAITDLLFLRY